MNHNFTLPWCTWRTWSHLLMVWKKLLCRKVAKLGDGFFSKLASQKDYLFTWLGNAWWKQRGSNVQVKDSWSKVEIQECTSWSAIGRKDQFHSIHGSPCVWSLLWKQGSGKLLSSGNNEDDPMQEIGSENHKKRQWFVLDDSCSKIVKKYVIWVLT